MATNQVFTPHRTRSLPVPDGTKSNEPVIVGSLVGVALTDEGKGGNADNVATVALDGAFDLPVSTNTTRAIGDPIYIITASRVLTTTANSGANPVFGYALEAKGGAPATIAVEIAQV